MVMMMTMMIMFSNDEEEEEKKEEEEELGGQGLAGLSMSLSERYLEVCSSFQLSAARLRPDNLCKSSHNLASPSTFRHCG